MRKKKIVYSISLGLTLFNLMFVKSLQVEHSNHTEHLKEQIDVLKTDNNTLRNNIAILEAREKNLTKRLHTESKKTRSNVTRDREPKIFNVTAYTDTPECQGIWVGQTASGKPLKEWHTIAAGKNIPFGTTVYIPYFKDKPNKGIFTVEDRGGAIKDNNIDVFMHSVAEAKKFGRRDLEVYIINWGG